ncbi:ABC transporter permease [Salidesulfovibrio onnuriiensis]|uniref:ABC transporter permease n=1 Tax=Salidesulfovibrio onnuriiensis TaxID=2583823 RepID=UPI0011CA6B35|nr:ABC transporter permease [Salidesulfovibrio onnuriiensis]
MKKSRRNIEHAPGAHMKTSREGGSLVLSLGGRLDAVSTAALWDDALDAVRTGSARDVVADCSGLEYLDGAGVALLIKLRQEVEDALGGSLKVENLREELRQVLGMAWGCAPPSWARTAGERRMGMAEQVGHFAEDAFYEFKRMVTFVGESVAIIFYCLHSPRCIRWKDVWLSLIAVGVQSLSIIMLIGFLMGLIMSFQTAISLQRFGAEIFVPNMLGLVMFREMGPLVTAILLAARSGSAFAAEIGTMKVNEEVDALVTMGLSPMRFLVAPKVLAALFAVPLMTMFFNFASLAGGALVMLSMDYPLVTFTSRVFRLLGYMDFAGGLFKACVFSLLVAGVGCLRGLETRTGASAVGVSTTSAVVSGIIAIAIADGLFALVFYYLGI